jgi:hypothetical protein
MKLPHGQLVAYGCLFVTALLVIGCNSKSNEGKHGLTHAATPQADEGPSWVVSLNSICHSEDAEHCKGGFGF